MRYGLIMISAVFFSPIVIAADIYVPDDYSKIQDAINAAVDGDMVIVRPGTYFENIDFKGKAITLLGEQGYDHTVIDGSKVNTVVRFGRFEGPDSVLTGFTIRNGHTYPYPSYEGAGIRCHGSSPTIINNYITSNTTIENSGGGIALVGSSAIILRNKIIDNTAKTGSGIYCLGSSPIIEYNVIEYNSGYGLSCSGGGIYFYADKVRIRSNIIHNNWAEHSAGISIVSTSGIIENNLISRNKGGLGVGGIYIGCDQNTTIRNNLIVGNWSNDGAAGVRFSGTPFFLNNTLSCNRGSSVLVCSGDAVLTNNIIWGNMHPIKIISGNPIITYCNIEGGWPGTGNIDADPLFVTGPQGDYYLSQINAGQGVESPCVDTGDPASSTIDGTTRTDGVQDEIPIDMGYHYPVPSGDPVVDVKINGSDSYIEIPVGQNNATIDWDIVCNGWAGMDCEVFLLLLRIENNLPVGVWSHVPGSPSYVNGILPFYTGALSDMSGTVTITAPPNVLKKVWLIVDNVPNGVPDKYCMIDDFVRFKAK